METLQQHGRMWFPGYCNLAVEPVELQHEAGDGHPSGDLERHAPDQVHAIPRVRVEGRVVQLLGVVQLLLRGAGRDGARPAGQQPQQTC